jgi:hypothetical protein
MYYKLTPWLAKSLTLETEVLPHVCLGVGIPIWAWVAKIGDTRGPSAGRESSGERRGRESVEEERAWVEERNWRMFMRRLRPIQRCG